VEISIQGQRDKIISAKQVLVSEKLAHCRVLSIGKAFLWIPHFGSGMFSYDVQKGSATIIGII
jgi:hypothetical protein